MIVGGEVIVGLLLLMAVFTLSTLYTRHYLHNLFEEFRNPLAPSHVDAEPIGSYDKVHQNNCPYSQWRKTPKHVDLIEKESVPTNDENVTPVGSITPFVTSYSSEVDMSSPSHTENSMFMFHNNVCSPTCCPSTYSCSGGCVCTNKQQRDLLKRRGKNKNVADDSI